MFQPPHLKIPSNPNNTLNMDQKEPVSPMGGVYLQPELSHVTYCVAGLKNSINIEALKNEISSSLLMKIPRFCSIPIQNPYDGTLEWKQTHVNIDDHLHIHHHDHHGHDDDNDAMSSDEDMINSYLADMAISSPMSLNKPLWDIHVLQEQKCLIVRVHHALADGMSLLSAAFTMGKKDKSQEIQPHDHHDGHINTITSSNKTINGYDNNKNGKKNSKKKEFGKIVWEALIFLWFSLVFMFKFLMRCLWVKDEVKEISGIEGVELWPRNVATARFKLSDMKAIKKAIPNATVNDVLYGILSYGFTRYLNVQYPQVRDGAEFTGLCPVNLRPLPGLQDLSKMQWGNKFAMILMPITYNKQEMDPLSYVAKAKKLMDLKKQSTEVQFSYNVMKLGSALFGPKVGGLLYSKIFHNTTFLISNVVGPPEEISIAGTPITYLRATSSSQPQAITMIMVSYAGMADLQIQVAKDVIPDPKFLAKCFEDALHAMKKAADNFVDY